MIKYVKGDLFKADVDALVNPVNTVGVMGKGVALEFKKRFPQNMLEYKRACQLNQVTVGKLFITHTVKSNKILWIINFPTKEDWRFPSRIEWIETGLISLHNFINESNINSIAIPALGVGNGGLSWQLVKSKIEYALSDFKNVNIYVYEPHGV